MLSSPLWIQQFERREGLLEAEGLRAKYFERLLRSHDRRRADAENLDALSVLETLCCNRLSGRRVEYCDQVGNDRSNALPFTRHEMFVLELDVKLPAGAGSHPLDRYRAECPARFCLAQQVDCLALKEDATVLVVGCRMQIGE